MKNLNNTPPYLNDEITKEKLLKITYLNKRDGETLFRGFDLGIDNKLNHL